MVCYRKIYFPTREFRVKLQAKTDIEGKRFFMPPQELVVHFKTEKTLSLT